MTILFSGEKEQAAANHKYNCNRRSFDFAQDDTSFQIRGWGWGRALRMMGATRVPRSSMACMSLSWARVATLIWKLMREMPPRASFIWRSLDVMVSGLLTRSALVGRRSVLNWPRVTGGQPRSWPILVKASA